MSSCQYCNNLDIPCYEAVAQSRNLAGYDGVSAISSVRPRGLKPFINIELEDILSGANVTGCKTCIFFRDALLAVFKTLDGIKRVECIGTRAGTLKVEVAQSPGFRNLEFYTLQGFPVSWPIIGPAREVSLDSFSDECFELAASWMKDCTENHEECLPSLERSLPTRVIHVGSGVTEPYLYVSKEETIPYTTLSHCWGGKVPMKTTVATFEERQKKIPFSELPKTFQDAIIITRRLGIQYIWIDSLCIIQDSGADWEKEAARMGAVYRNCLVCIAADGAVDSSGGCFIAGDSRRNFDIAQVKCPGNSKVHIRDSPQPMAGHGFAHVRTFKTVAPEYYESKLDTRGWVLQEQSLAPRTLHYTVAELAFDCATCIRCECTILPEEVEISAATMQLRACKRMVQHSTKPITAGIVDWEERPRWPNFVAMLTSRSLTYETDRLHAMSGMAAVLAGQNGDFLAGLWRDELPLGLLWRTHSNYANRTTLKSYRHDKYYAPSWSWASVTGEVKFIALPGASYNFKLVPDLEILEAACVSVGINPYGPVRSGYLKIRGILVSITPGNPANAAPIRKGLDCDVVGPGVTEIVDDEPLWALLVAHGERARPGMSDLEGYHCIVLRKSRLEASAFERVGCIWAMKDWEKHFSGRAELKFMTLL